MASILKITFSFILLAFSLSIHAMGYTGQCGDKITWSFEEDYTLYIQGEGNMWDYNESSSSAPWSSYNAQILKVQISEGITSIGSMAFSNCLGLTSIHLPNTIVTIGDNAFKGCVSLSSAILGNSVTSIGASAFQDCYSLSSINIPSSVKRIGDFAFANCVNIRSLYFNWNKPINLSDNVFDNIPKSISTLYVPLIYVENYKSSVYWKDFAAILPQLEEIEDYHNTVYQMTKNISGQFMYNITNPWNYGYSSFFLIRDVEGQDIVSGTKFPNWYRFWYTGCKVTVPVKDYYSYVKIPLDYYYDRIRECNTVIKMAGGSDYTIPYKERMIDAGNAYFYRAMFYFDLARMYAESCYASDINSLTVPKITESTSSQEKENKRMTWEEAVLFILKDLDTAQRYLEEYNRTDKYTPDISVINGIRARVYLEIEDWANAEKYANLALQGTQFMDEAAYTSRVHGFNTPNDSWIFGLEFRPYDPAIMNNDGDTSWGSWMILEVSESGCGYAANYGYPMYIDRHLYESIPATDFRKKCYIDFAIDELESEAEKTQALRAYSDVPEGLLKTARAADGVVGGLPLKFRPKNGEHRDQYAAFAVSLPLMRAEEMKLIEIEAVGMQNEANGIKLLEEFAKTRNANYVYGQHNESYFDDGNNSAFRNEVWWQRRVELWGEGFATFDIKRLQKGIMRNYEGTNHVQSERINIEHTPDWMVWSLDTIESYYDSIPLFATGSCAYTGYSSNKYNGMSIPITVNYSLDGVFYKVMSAKEYEEKASSDLADYIKKAGYEIMHYPHSGESATVSASKLSDGDIIAIAAFFGNESMVYTKTFQNPTWTDIYKGTYTFYNRMPERLSAMPYQNKVILQKSDNIDGLYRIKDLYGVGYHLLIYGTGKTEEDENGKYELGCVPATETPYSYSSYGAVSCRDVYYWQNRIEGYLEDKIYENFSIDIWMQYFVSTGSIGYGWEHFEPEESYLSVESLNTNPTTHKKVFINNQILIEHDGNYYSPMGVKINGPMSKY